MKASHARQIVTVVCMYLLTLPANALAQVSAAASVRFSATLHGGVSINTRTVSVSIPLQAGIPSSNQALVPLEFSWNLNPREVQGFEVIGYFARPNAALVSESGTVIPSAQVLGSWGDGYFRPFSETHEIGSAHGSLSLFSEPVRLGNSRGTRTGILELRIDPQLAPALSSDDYRGVLYIEVRHY
jgi:hypothetical protein